MLRKLKFFQKKLKLNTSTFLIKKDIGDIILGEYLSIDRDGIHQYKLGGICLSISNKVNNQHILLRQKLMSLEFDYLVNTSSPLLYMFKVARQRLKNRIIRDFII